MVTISPASARSASESELAFNLWRDPWIDVTRPGGGLERVGLHDALEQAHDLRAVYDLSPLVAVSVQRLLIAIVQAMHQPSSVDDVADVLTSGQFDRARVAAFGSTYHQRFDLFSPDTPFLQTADVPLTPGKASDVKTVAYLLPEDPAGTNVVHFRHIYDTEHRLCPACTAKGLVTIPAFATSGGAGIKPSINGVPPLYVLPAGDSLFQSLALSLIAPHYQPEAKSDHDQPVWEGPTIITRGDEVLHVGYVQSLTFPARRVRLFPQQSPGHCTRCGAFAEIRVSGMVFEMGQSRPKDAPVWFDPFAAYSQTGSKPPVPLRPVAGKALWREYAPLFLTQPTGDTPKTKTVRPRVVEQLYALEERGVVEPRQRLSFRCAGLRTDMKAKVFEWTDGSLEVPAGLLTDSKGARLIQQGIENATTWQRDLVGIFSRIFAPSASRDRYGPIRERLRAAYWTALTQPFVTLVLTTAERSAMDEAREAWNETVLRTGFDLFALAAEEVGDRGSDLRRRVQAVNECRRTMYKHRKDWNG